MGLAPRDLTRVFAVDFAAGGAELELAVIANMRGCFRTISVGAAHAFIVARAANGTGAVVGMSVVL